jgi:hypothetical protein
MSWLKAIMLETYGLFVDDGSFAIAIIVWLGIALFILPRLDIPASANALILFAGLLLVLFESALRQAAK